MAPNVDPVINTNPILFTGFAGLYTVIHDTYKGNIGVMEKKMEIM